MATLNAPGIEERRAQLQEWLEPLGLSTRVIVDDYAARVRHDHLQEPGLWRFTYTRLRLDDEGQAIYVDRETREPVVDRRELGEYWTVLDRESCSLLVTTPPPGWNGEPLWSISMWLHRGIGAVEPF